MAALPAVASAKHHSSGGSKSAKKADRNRDGLPDRWEKVQDIFTGIDLVDATLFAHDGRWWLLGNVSEPGADKHDELHAFHAETPLGPWLPHAANPVVADARFARPAGPVFTHEGKLLRPA